MTYVTEFAIEETIIDVNNRIDRPRETTRLHTRYFDLATAQADAEREQDRFNAYAAKNGGQARVECKVVPVKLGFANNYLWTDVEPFEIVRVVSDKTIEVRKMKAERAEDWKPNMVSGGFAFHCTNNADQRKAWVMTPDTDAETIRIRKQKDGRWKNPSFGLFRLAEQPAKKYDFNF